MYAVFFSYSLSHDFILTVTNVEKDNAGRYRCVASNPQSTAKSKVAKLTVNSKSRFSIAFQFQKSTEP